MKRRLVLLLLVFTAAFGGDGPTITLDPPSLDPVDYGGGPDDSPTE
jgi:hypothetical protein